MSNGRKILVVDDDEATCDLLQMMLKRQDYEAVTETSARAALNRIANEEFTAVFTDPDMAGLGGIELCPRIAGGRPHISLVFVTRLGGPRNAPAPRPGGGVGFVPQP